MGRRWAPATIALIRAGLEARDGLNCVLCFAEPSTPLEIDHIDPSGPSDFPNLRLLCKACNLARRRKPKRKDRGILCESEGVRQKPLDLEIAPTVAAKNAIPYTNGSPEMMASGWFEPRFRSWVLTQIPLPKQEAIAAGAEFVGCSIETATRYLAKMTSRTGQLRTVQDAQGTVNIIQKEEPHGV